MKHKRGSRCGKESRDSRKQRERSRIGEKEKCI